MKNIRPPSPQLPQKAGGFLTLPRIILLGLAAWAGFSYYEHMKPKFAAMSNNTAPGQAGLAPVFGAAPEQAESAGIPYGSQFSGGIGKIGGLGNTGPLMAFNSNPFTTPAAPASPTTAPPSKETVALLEATAKGDDAALREMLSKGADVNTRDASRKTLLIIASESGHDTLCATLLSAGANIRLRDKGDHDALDYAAGRGLTDTVALLLARADIADERHTLQYAQLMRASYAGNAGALPQGKLPSINRVAPDGASPLHVAANSGSVALAEALIARGAKVNLANEAEQTPAHWAAWNNQAAMLELLAAKGADLSRADHAGNSPLILAVENKSIQAATWLIGHGASKTTRNKQGKTARIIAEEKGLASISNLLK